MARAPAPHAARPRLGPSTALAQLGEQYLLALRGRDVAGDCPRLVARRPRAAPGGAAFSPRRFVANATHQLRTPLTVIRAETEVASPNPTPTSQTCAHGPLPCSTPPSAWTALLDRLLVLAIRPRRCPARAARPRGGRRRRRQPPRPAPPASTCAPTWQLVPAGVRGERLLLERLVDEPHRERRQVQRARWLRGGWTPARRDGGAAAARRQQRPAGRPGRRRGAAARAVRARRPRARRPRRRARAVDRPLGRRGARRARARSRRAPAAASQVDVVLPRV